MISLTRHRVGRNGVSVLKTTVTGTGFTERKYPELTKMLDRMTEGDTVVVESLSRLGHSTKGLIELTELFERKGVHLVSLKESIDTSSSTGKFLFTLMSAIAQFERDVADRTKEGLPPREPEGVQAADPKRILTQ